MNAFVFVFVCTSTLLIKNCVIKRAPICRVSNYFVIRVYPLNSQQISSLTQMPMIPSNTHSNAQWLTFFFHLENVVNCRFHFIYTVKVLYKYQLNTNQLSDEKEISFIRPLDTNLYVKNCGLNESHFTHEKNKNDGIRLMVLDTKIQ